MRIAAALALLCLSSWHAHAACNIVNGRAYGDCSNVTINRTAPVFLEVREVHHESTIIAGATVFQDGSLYLNGISNGDITVQIDGSLFVSGIVNGRIVNEGGSVQVEGTVGTLVMRGGTASIAGVVGSVIGDGEVTCEPGAVLGGRPHTGGKC